jgi:hypothetical protein
MKFRPIAVPAIPQARRFGKPDRMQIRMEFQPFLRWRGAGIPPASPLLRGQRIGWLISPRTGLARQVTSRPRQDRAGKLRTNNWNMTFFRTFKFKERATLEFRAETYNRFNQTQFSGVNASAEYNATGQQANVVRTIYRRCQRPFHAGGCPHQFLAEMALEELNRCLDFR